MLHTEYQGSKPCGFRQDLFMFLPMKAYVRAHFGPQGHYLNTLGRGPLYDATDQISRL